MNNRIILGDALTELKKLDSGIARCCITSPPYWQKVDYGVDGQYGLEPRPEQFIELMTAVFMEAARVVADDGSIWINIDSTYASGGRGGGGSYADIRNESWGDRKKQTGWRKEPPGWRDKELIPIPWMLTMALHNAGLIFRRDNVWHKTNGMMESCKDRSAHGHEYVLQFVKQGDYYFNHQASRVPAKGKPEIRNKAAEGYTGDFVGGQRFSEGARQYGSDDGLANRRSVWTGPTSSYRGEHRNTMPQWMCKLLVETSSEPGDIVLDPFLGAGSTGLAAAMFGRNFIGIELNPKSAQEAMERIGPLLVRVE